MAGLLESKSDEDSEEYLRYKKKVIQNVIKAIDKECTPRQKEVVSMFFYEQKTVTEIAEELGIEKSTVSRTLMRGMRHIQRALIYTI